MAHSKKFNHSTGQAARSSLPPAGVADHQQLVQAISPIDLTPIVRRALNQPTLVITRWQQTQIHGGVGGGFRDTSVYRFNGQGRAQGQAFDWSVILKILSPRPFYSPSDPAYWRREIEAYRSGWLDQLPGHLRAPKCLRITDYPGQACLLWQEDVPEQEGRRWSVEAFRQAARHLGQFNGAYLVSGALPEFAWLGQSPPYDANRSAATIEALPALASHPVVQRVLPGDSITRLNRIWGYRTTLRAVLDHLPQTVCHFDAFRRNLFIQRPAGGSERTVAIDWAYVGRGAIGEDAAALAFLSLFFMEAEVSTAQDFDAALFADYVAGLQDAGWHGPIDQIRLGYLSHFILRWLELIRCVDQLYLDERHYPFLETVADHQYTALEMIDNHGAVNQFTLTLADEALVRLNAVRVKRHTARHRTRSSEQFAVWPG